MYKVTWISDRYKLLKWFKTRGAALAQVELCIDAGFVCAVMWLP